MVIPSVSYLMEKSMFIWSFINYCVIVAFGYAKFKLFYDAKMVKKKEEEYQITITMIKNAYKLHLLRTARRLQKRCSISNIVKNRYGIFIVPFSTCSSFATYD